MIFNDLLNRGLIKQQTSEKICNLLNESSITFYIGFDPTADSLHIGHLLQLVTAKRLIDAGHKPIMLMGGATALIGDPTGKTDMRKMLSQDDINKNIKSIESQIKNIVGNIDNPNFVVNNNSWFESMNFLTFIRDIGKHFSVNNMLRADCFKSRLESGGLSFLEFNYMLMQAFDFFRLSTSALNCVLQIGGDDQWSNILAGIDLIHKKAGKEVFGLTIPLLVNSSGQKMGKTEKGAVWLSSEKTSVFDFFQFWRNVSDTEVINLFKLLTFVPLSDINKIPFTSVEEINIAKKSLAFEITKIVHGEKESLLALKRADSLFDSKDSSILDSISINNGINILDLIVKCNFAKSKTEARNLINGKGITINNNVITDPTIIVDLSKFGEELLVKKGKKNFCRLTIKE
jgi:tyrosyl-tRNA synthetase